MLRRMPSVYVDLGERSYEVRVENGLLARAGDAIRSAGLSGKAAVITDETVGHFHAAALTQALIAQGFTPTLHTLPAGEASKSMAQVDAVCSSLAAAGHDRRSFVIALGGGVVGDLAGFVAAVFYRGIPFVQIPTTIVAQVDSSVGGKTGVNLPEGKNLLGAFHQPRLVIVDPAVLATLPGREYREGFAEVIKHAAIRDGSMLAEIAALDPATREVPADLIARNIAIKARIVEADEYETLGLRALLNLGHTIGHGIEAAVPYGDMLHGEAISLGLRASLFLSEKHAGLSPDTSREILALLKKFELPLVLDHTISGERVLEKLGRDKKFEAGNIRFVLLRAPGDAYLSDQVTPEDLAEAVAYLRIGC
ncbi:3-dehydroquinate synthase [Luteolibacter arcticus]|uniref:3-dehydroquinate synthase n=1 Tax=Luteolibacter arcticus TaxID=1581411 RepID=A0ABT3GDN4_9BACT|nr:3-dehydroquinate synthase [Luteolibacter arcticus]MCW1921737.1 3-dehydroquinate synthase [Luteolibacter arcticus]